MTEAAIADHLHSLTAAVKSLSRMMGARLTQAEVCARIGIHRNTLRRYIEKRGFPTAGRDGKWLLEEVIDWELRK